MPLSNDPVKRSAQLANLQPGRGAAGVGNQRRLTHGAYAQITEAELEAKSLELFDAIAADAPVRTADGGLPAHDTIAVRLLAETLIRRERVRAEELAHGLEIASGPRKGELRGVVQYGLRLDAQVLDLLDRLAMTPKSRAALGLDLARTARTLEDELADGRAAWEVIDVDAEEADGHESA